MCDMISDAVLDSYVEKDPKARVACEVATTTGVVFCLGEITSDAVVDVSKVIRSTIKEIGYVGEDFGFDANTCSVLCSIDKQSEDINLGVSDSYESKKAECHEEKQCESDEKDHIGAGDQGMMFGYACNETESLMPAPIYYAHLLSKRLSEVRKQSILDYIGPDGKSMVTFEYQDGKPVRIDTIVVSTQHKAEVEQSIIYEDVMEYVIKPVIPSKFIDEQTKVLINPTGRFCKGGPAADTGLTGRKIIVDTYGGVGRHGGGAFSGKDATKVDRTGAYAARYIAKNIVAAGLADQCDVQIAYAIGVANPVSITVNTFGTSIISDEDIGDMVKELFDLRPAALIQQFGMRKPIFKQLAAYGHMGRTDLDIAWEKTDKVEEITRYMREK